MLSILICNYVFYFSLNLKKKKKKIVVPFRAVRRTDLQSSLARLPNPPEIGFRAVPGHGFWKRAGPSPVRPLILCGPGSARFQKRARRARPIWTGPVHFYNTKHHEWYIT